MIIIEESFDNCFGKYPLSSETITKSLKIAYIYSTSVYYIIGHKNSLPQWFNSDLSLW